MPSERTLGRRAVLAGLAGVCGTARASADRSDGSDATRPTTGRGSDPTRRAARPAAPSFEPSAWLDVRGTTDAVVSDDGTTAYVAAVDGFAVVDVRDPAAPRTLSTVRGVGSDHPDGPMKRIWDVRVAGDRLAVAGPGLPVPSLAGVAVFDVSDPTAPERIGLHQTDHAVHNVAFDGRVAYLTNNDDPTSPVVAVDLSGEPRRIGSFTPARYGVAPWMVHDAYVSDGTLYACYWDDGTWVVDVSDPADPKPRLRVGSDVTDGPETSRDELPGNAHYAQPHPERPILAVGKEAFEDDETSVDGAPGGIELWDLTGPTRASVLAPPPEAESLETGTAHNFGWRGDRLYTSWYGGGVVVYRVADPARPERLAGWRDADDLSVFTAKPTAGSVVAANWHASGRAGLYLFPEPSADSADPARLTEPLAPPLVTTEFPEPTATPVETTTSTETTVPSETPPTDGTASSETTATPERTGETRGETTLTTPGFGLPTAVAAAGLAGWRLRRRTE